MLFRSPWPFGTQQFAGIVVTNYLHRPILPAVVVMVLVAPRSAVLVQQRGSRNTLLIGQVLLALAFVAMFVLWDQNANYLLVAIPLVLMGAGVGLAGTPSSNSLTIAVRLALRKTTVAGRSARMAERSAATIVCSDMLVVSSPAPASGLGYRAQRFALISPPAV